MKLTLQLMSRYFKNYVELELNKDNLRRTWNPYTGWKELKRVVYDYGEERPWTSDFKNENVLGKRPKFIPVEPIKEWNLFKGDRVKVLVGRDKGKIGLIISIIKERNWVYVEGMNCEFIMQSIGQNVPPSCVKVEKPLLIPSQVKLIDPQDNEITEVEWKYTESGEKVRTSIRTGRIIPLPGGAQELEDFVNPLSYTAGEKDTSENDVLEVTFKPGVRLFEDEIMGEMGIKETRKRAKTYWH